MGARRAIPRPAEPAERYVLEAGDRVPRADLPPRTADATLQNTKNGSSLLNVQKEQL